MAKSTEVAVKDDAALSTEFADLEAELTAQNAEETEAADLQIPLLKIGQALTSEVVEGEARPGEFINSLTREGLGEEVQFVVAGFQKGRFDHGDRKAGLRARKAYGMKNVPWNDDPHYGEAFSEHPDAEETYSKRVNAGEIDWGKGPRISTTFDFTGFVVPEEGEEPLPVCLSLMRMNRKAAQKWYTLLKAVLQNRYWDAVFTLSTDRVSNDSGTFYVINIKQARKTTPEEKQRALQLAQVLRSRNVEVVGDEDEAAPAGKAPDAAGGMEV